MSSFQKLTVGTLNSCYQTEILMRGFRVSRVTANNGVVTMSRWHEGGQALSFVFPGATEHG